MCAIELESPDSYLIVPTGLLSPFQLFKTVELQFCSFQARVPEQETMERTDQSVRKYKRQSEEMLSKHWNLLKIKRLKTQLWKLQSV